MTEVSFHFNVPDRLGYACRLLRKATRMGARVAVTAPQEALNTLDRALWVFEPTEFGPPVRRAAGIKATPRQGPTPIWLVEQVADAPEHDVLLNLSQQVPAGFESFARLIEIVSTDDSDRHAARDRWKHYTGRGYAITRHEVGDER